MKSAPVGNGNVHWQNKCHATTKSIERVESLDSLQLCLYSDVPRRRSIDRTAYKQLSRARNKQTNNYDNHYNQDFEEEEEEGRIRNLLNNVL